MVRLRVANCDCAVVQLSIAIVNLLIAIVQLSIATVQLRMAIIQLIMAIEKLKIDIVQLNSQYMTFSSLSPQTEMECHSSPSVSEGPSLKPR